MAIWVRERRLRSGWVCFGRGVALVLTGLLIVAAAVLACLIGGAN